MTTIIKNGVAYTYNKPQDAGSSIVKIKAIDAATTPEGVSWKQGQATVTGTLEATEKTKDYIVFVSATSQEKDLYDEYIVMVEEGAYSWEKLGRSIEIPEEIIYGYLHNGIFYEDASHTTEIAPEAKKEYIDLTGASRPASYIWNGEGYIAIGLQTSDLGPYRPSSEQDAIDNGIKDRISEIESKENAWDEKYVKPEGGIPASDMAAGVIPDVSQFITKTVNDLANYYLKAETYTRAEVLALINAIKQFAYEVVSELPVASANTMQKIYLVPSSNPKTKNVRDEFITIDNGEGTEERYTWEQFGSTTIDLSNYPTIQAMNAAITAAMEGDEMTALAIIINQQNARIEALESALRNGLKRLVIDDLEVRHKLNLFVSDGNSYLRGAGAPSADITPENWNEDEYGPWTGVPQFIGQRYLNTSTNKWYTAKDNAAVSDWVQDTNA